MEETYIIERTFDDAQTSVGILSPLNSHDLLKYGISFSSLSDTIKKEIKKRFKTEIANAKEQHMVQVRQRKDCTDQKYIVHQFIFKYNIGKQENAENLKIWVGYFCNIDHNKNHTVSIPTQLLRFNSIKVVLFVPWESVRLIWIAHTKEPESCFSILPKDIIKEIMIQIRKIKNVIIMDDMQVLPPDQ